MRHKFSLAFVAAFAVLPLGSAMRSGCGKWLLLATGTRDEGGDQSDHNLRKQRLSGFRRCR